MSDSGALHRKTGLGLSARLLLLTVFFVMLSEVLIYVPSIARFRKSYLEERIARAHLSTLALQDAPDWALSRAFTDELLTHAEVYGVVVQRGDARILAIGSDMPPAVDATFDLRHMMAVNWAMEAFETLGQTENRVLRIIGSSPQDEGVAVEVVLDEAPLRDAMLAYSTRILQLSVVISLFTAGLVYVSLQWLLVRPIRRITESMVRFRQNPEGDPLHFPKTMRSDEVGLAQHELAVMQNQLRTALRQKSRLAALGEAVAKINHDLRNSLATAMLVSDHLADVDDPQVKRVLPRLYTAMDRAVELCHHTLEYARDPALSMRKEPFHLHELINEVGADLRAPGAAEHDRDLEWRNEIDPMLSLNADRHQIFRVFKNLGRNAFQAGAQSVSIRGYADGATVIVDVVDDGPGLPGKTLDNLFKPFAGSARKGGTGLGLVIAQDILRAHKGSITLTKSDGDGTAFRLELTGYQDPDGTV